MLTPFELDFMVHAFLACLIIGGLLSYLGVHVVSRGIVFVDLALGQISSLGVAFSQFLHLGESWLPELLTLVGAVLLSLINVRDRRLKLEAIIGIIYVITAAVTVLIISKTAHGEANIQEVLFGSLLAVTPGDLQLLGAVFLLLGILHILFRRPVFEITERMSNGELERLGPREKAWNFFFYLSIGLAIVFAVRIAGVMPVFAFLVVPPVSAMLVAKARSVVIWVSLLFSAVVSYLGLWCSYSFDFPAGPSVVAVFGVLFALASVWRGVRLLRK